MCLQKGLCAWHLNKAQAQEDDLRVRHKSRLKAYGPPKPWPLLSQVVVDVLGHGVVKDGALGLVQSDTCISIESQHVNCAKLVL